MLVAFLLMEIWELSSPFSFWPPPSEHRGERVGRRSAASWTICSPTIPGNLPAQVWSVAESQNTLLPPHTPDMKVPAPLERDALGWTERLDERTPKLGYPIWSLTRIWLNMLLMQSYRLLPLPSPSEITGMQHGDKLKAVWESVGQDSASWRGVSGTASSAPVSGCLWNEFTGDGGTAFSSSSCDKETPAHFKQAAAPVILLWANESNASCLTDWPACLNPPPTLRGKANC